MTSELKQANRRLRDFWRKQIEKLQNYKGVLGDLTNEEGLTWKDILFEVESYQQINDTAFSICQYIYNNATQNQTDDAPENEEALIADLTTISEEMGEEVEIKAVDEEEIELSPQVEWEGMKNELFFDYETKITELSANTARLNQQIKVVGILLDKVLKYEPTNEDLNDRNLGVERYPYWKNLKKNVLGGRSLTKVLKHERRLISLIAFVETELGLGAGYVGEITNIRNGKTLQELRDDSNELTIIQGQITASGKTLAELIAGGGGACPNPNHHTNYNNLQADSTELQRIDNKLGRRMSDAELQALLDAIPNCSHSDYDNLKSENQTLKTENDQLKEHKCDCDSKVAEKEKEIINKIITDLSLSTERERENALEAVITEIKNKITPLSDNSQLSQLQTQLRNKEAEITELKKGNKGYFDLEKLVEQKKAENQALTTAKNELERQLNEKQKDLLTQVLNKSAEVREKVYKEEVIKSIETVLTSQGIDSQKFRQEITNLSSLTDIQQLSGKYSSQKLSKLEDSKKTSYSLSIALGVLNVASLIAIVYLLIKGFNKEIGKSLKEEKGK